MEIFKFIFSNFWYFIGTFILLSVVFQSIGYGIGKIGRKKICKCKCKCKYCKNFEETEG